MVEQHDKHCSPFCLLVCFTTRLSDLSYFGFLFEMRACCFFEQDLRIKYPSSFPKRYSWFVVLRYSNTAKAIKHPMRKYIMNNSRMMHTLVWVWTVDVLIRMWTADSIKSHFTTCECVKCPVPTGMACRNRSGPIQTPGTIREYPVNTDFPGL